MFNFLRSIGNVMQKLFFQHFLNNELRRIQSEVRRIQSEVRRIQTDH